MPRTYCFYEYVDDLDQLIINKCRQRDGSAGTCYPIDGQSRQTKFSEFTLRPPKLSKRLKVSVNVDNKLLNEAINDANDVRMRQLSHEKYLIKSGIYQKANTMESFHQGFFGGHDTHRQTITRDGCLLMETSRSLAQKLNLEPHECHSVLSQYHLNDSQLRDRCLVEPHCDLHMKYRTYDGSCNNLKHPLWGRSMTQLVRLLEPEYSDGIDSFRKAIDGSDLPSARELSTTLTMTDNVEHPKLSALFLQFGQFIDHDMTLGLSTRTDSGEGLSCCENTDDGQLIQHPACRPIMILSNDPFYSRYNHSCNNFVRSIPAPNTACVLGPREQAGAVTHAIDGSHIYGSNGERVKFVRSYIDGKLKTQIINGREFLPSDKDKQLSVVCAASGGHHCIYAGDIRVNQQFGLTVLHLLFLREHNRIAGKLRLLNPEWTDETLFQESRRIIGAQLQWITYNEFLPLAIGRNTMKNFKLFPSSSGFSNKYNVDTNLGIINEFATAAFRWHTLVQNSYHLMNANGVYTGHHVLRNIFNDPTPMYRVGAVDEVIYGTAVQPSQDFDPIFVDEIKHQLFPSPNFTFGGDLIAINIQRGRDHGLQPYVRYREICGLPKITSFDDLKEVFRFAGAVDLFAKMYRSVDDIDLYMGGIHERPVKDGIMGPVFTCIVAEQFRRTKEGDRFWFENYGLRHSFTSAQLYQIRKVSLASIICANGDSVRYFQSLALLMPSNSNPIIKCTEIPHINLNQWRNFG